MNKIKILVTGGAGFIGSAFVRLAVKKGYKIIVVDKLTYAGDLQRLEEVKRKIQFYKTDICDRRQIESIFRKNKPRAVVHFAAESDVDRSIQDCAVFMNTNIIGTQILIEASRKYKVKKLIHISSDEVYGEIIKGSFNEHSPLEPSSPYSASKAAADLLIKSYIRTYSFPAVIIRPCNNYGPWQYPEKLIPLAVLRVLKKEKIPIYARGQNVREWLYVDDCAEAILKTLKKGRIGEIYNLGSNQEKENFNTITMLLKILKADKSMIKFVKDRPGHDIRYRLNSRKLFNEAGWRPKVDFKSGLKKTVEWHLEHKNWLLSKWHKIAPLYKKCG